MSYCSCRKVALLAALSLSAILLQGIGSPATAQPDTINVRLLGSIDLDLFPRITDTILTHFDGEARIIWNSPVPYFVTAEIDTCRLWNWRGVWMKNEPIIPSIGQLDLPGDDPWIESFFDIYFEIHVPQYPGETLKMYMPLHLEGMANAWPPYFDNFSMPLGMPPIPLYSEGIESGHILSFETEMVPYYEPEVQVSVPTAYGSEVAELDEAGLIPITAALTGEHEATEAVFSYRLCGDPGPFTVFYVDMDGAARHIPTVDPTVSGDGWTGYFDPGSDPFEGGQCVEFAASLFVPGLGMLADTTEVWVEETPPIPVFHGIPPDSIGNFDIDSFFDVTFRLDDELPVPPALSEVISGYH